jgi:hypothetical protein
MVPLDVMACSSVDQNYFRGTDTSIFRIPNYTVLQKTEIYIMDSCRNQERSTPKMMKCTQVKFFDLPAPV